MRILAIDYGDARTGLAVSDALGMLAGEAWTVSDWNADRLAETIAAAVRERNVEKIVLGLPLNRDGSRGPRAEKSEALAAKLRELTDVEIVMWDERLTTVDAHRILSDAGKRGKKRKQVVDAVAATLILESYLSGR